MATWTSRGAERLLPVGRAALADVAQLGGTGRHPLAELGREAVERVLRHTERLQALIGEGDRDPRVVSGIGRRPSRVDERVQPSHELAAGGAVVDAQQQVGADVGRGSLVQRAALDVVELEDGSRRAAVACGSIVSGGARALRAGPGSAASR